MSSRPSVRRTSIAAVVTAIGAAALVVGPALGPVGTAGAVEQTDTYACVPGSAEPAQFVVPAGVTSVTIEAFGAQGASVNAFEGGLGGSATATMAVTSGNVIHVHVGCAGTDVVSDVAGAAGEPGGGGAAGVGGKSSGGAGGGASVVTLLTGGSHEVVVVAGGGGGAGSGADGGAGSGNEPAVRGSDFNGIVTGGEGGGTAGCSNADTGAGQGDAADGGPCASFPATGGAGGSDAGGTVGGGGGGGGGFQGGGGGGAGCGDCSGSAGAGGGGGSGKVQAPAVDTSPVEPGSLRASAVGTNSGNGRVVIRYTAPPAALTVSPRFTG